MFGCELSARPEPPQPVTPTAISVPASSAVILRDLTFAPHVRVPGLRVEAPPEPEMRVTSHPIS
ncbi:hypothetical protein GTS_12320 [Gandjariella thermophila]|uniref:Uncharacterized protein n=1 Tax=Gandjariella thermophila TaxID=1931992 RepID=A0A4D4J4P5_9PSEU|nr:hypothetical protein GTS_12320 [Gandjariella thermophila]